MDPCLLDGYGLPYASLGGGLYWRTLLPPGLWCVVFLGDMIFYGWRVHFRDQGFLSCPCELNFLERSYIQLVFLFPYSIPPLCFAQMQCLQGTWYTTPAFSCGVLLSFGCTNILLRVRWVSWLLLHHDGGTPGSGLPKPRVTGTPRPQRPCPTSKGFQKP